MHGQPKSLASVGMEVFSLVDLGKSLPGNSPPATAMFASGASPCVEGKKI